MKRMHALPIELPLVASGEFLPNSATFKLDTDLRLYDNKIFMFLIVDESNEDSFSGILNIVNIQNKDYPCYCWSSVFPIRVINDAYEITVLHAAYDEDPIDHLYMISLAGPGNPQPVGTLLIYLYELPITHKDL